LRAAISLFKGGSPIDAISQLRHKVISVKACLRPRAAAVLDAANGIKRPAVASAWLSVKEAADA